MEGNKGYVKWLWKQVDINPLDLKLAKTDQALTPQIAQKLPQKLPSLKGTFETHSTLRVNIGNTLRVFLATVAIHLFGVSCFFFKLPQILS